ncbi:thiopeptide-type bacteriocin biosynthesis protein [Aquimarina algiphila]|uniref:thiopeptide-type bacteriocin biosynthesis protein n=1 Tax=Aquimarina algiphila TaxID=2047982 RepID=UPI002490B8B6|nr:thiopeptide-type bacteriocin biosynthesis protein [Aquimarina algiphila]
MIEKNKERIFMVGSRWLYYKIYSGIKISDELLIVVIDKLTHKFSEKKMIDKWFFIRYADPEQHIRLRFHLTDLDYISDIIREMNSELELFVNKKMISSVQIGMYNRELERYGNYTIEESESLFHLNSVFIINLTKLIKDKNNLWLFGMKFIDRFLDLWNLSLEDKKALLENLKNSFGQEHGINKALKKQLSLKFRHNRKNIEHVIENYTNAQVESFLETHQELAAPIIHEILKKKSNNLLEIPLDDLLSSYLHMHCNRLFRSRQRTNEWVLYDLLYNYYYSKHARLKKHNK